MPDEDFAETFRFYVTRRGRLRELFGARLEDPEARFEEMRYLEQAVDRDSSFVHAWAALADAYLLG